MNKCFIIGKLAKLNKRILFGYFRYWDSKIYLIQPTTLDFIPEHEESNLKDEISYFERKIR
jgi:hypothetical protein